MRINKKYLFLIPSILGILGILTIYKKNNIPFIIIFNKDKVETINEDEIIYLEDLEIGNITITGITYDEKNNSFWIADYDSNLEDNIVTPRIIETDADIKKVKTIINLNNNDINLQGISYSKNSDTLWIATGKNIINIEKNGKEISKIKIDSKYKCNTNGLFFDNDSNYLNVLCYEKYLLEIDKFGKINKKYKINIRNQDHITKINSNLYLTAGANYYGQNYIFVFSKDIKLQKIYELKKSYAVEGISYKDNKLYVANDGVFHNAKIKKNYIAIYNLVEE